MKRVTISTASISFVGGRYGISISYLNGSCPDRVNFMIWDKTHRDPERPGVTDFVSVYLTPDQLANLLITRKMVREDLGQDG